MTTAAAAGRHSAVAGTLRLVAIYPGLLGTYGDRGNGAVLAHRASSRGLAVDLREVVPGAPVPRDGSIYLLGGGEDEAQLAATELLAADGGLAAAAGRGAVVFAVCAGLQILGRRFLGPGDRPVPGLGLLDVQTVRRLRPRAVGELLVEPDPALGLPALTGYENHGGATTLGPAARPIGRVVRGVGNDGGGTEGVMGAGRVLGTYLHGPALARNPALADLLLGWAVGPLPALADDGWPQQLHRERVAAARGRSGGPRWPRLARTVTGRRAGR